MNLKYSAWCCVVAVLVIISPRCYSAKDILTEFDKLNEDIWNYDETSPGQWAQKTLDTLCDEYDIFVQSKKISCRDISLRTKFVGQEDGFEEHDRLKRQADDKELEGSGEPDDVATTAPPPVIVEYEKIESVTNKRDELEELPSSLSKIVDEEQPVQILLLNRTLTDSLVSNSTERELNSQNALKINQMSKDLSKETLIPENQTQQIAKEMQHINSSSDLRKIDEGRQEENNNETENSNSFSIILLNKTSELNKLNGDGLSDLLESNSTERELNSKNALIINQMPKDLSKETVIPENQTEQIPKKMYHINSSSDLLKKEEGTKEINSNETGYNNSEKELKTAASVEVTIKSSEVPETDSDKQNSIKSVKNPLTKEKETIDEQQDGNTEILLRQPAVAVAVKGTEISESEKILNNMEVSAESRSNKTIEKASKDTTILIVLFVVVVVIGGAAFTYNKVKQRNSNRSTVSSNHVTEKPDVEQGTELKPLMKNDQKLVTSESIKEKS